MFGINGMTNAVRCKTGRCPRFFPSPVPTAQRYVPKGLLSLWRKLNLRMTKSLTARTVLTMNAMLLVYYGLPIVMEPPGPTEAQYLSVGTVLFGFAPLAAAAVSLVSAFWMVPDPRKTEDSTEGGGAK